MELSHFVSIIIYSSLCVDVWYPQEQQPDLHIAKGNQKKGREGRMLLWLLPPRRRSRQHGLSSTRPYPSESMILVLNSSTNRR